MDTGNLKQFAMSVRHKRVRKHYKLYSFPYFPHVSVGWDNNPRYTELLPYVTTKNTPEAFYEAMQMARRYLDKNPERPRLITINSWNEWTESSYLEPDDQYGYGYLNAIRKMVQTEK